MSASGNRALLIANSTYPNDAQNLPDLEGPRNDPALLRDALCDDRFGLFAADSVRLVVERTMAEVLREAEEFLRTASRQDTLLLYYSGHGKLDLSGQLYLCARDTRADRLRSTAVKASDLSAMIEESAAATTVILLDCCHSGAFKGGELAQALAGRGRFVVTSCRSGELANDSHTLNRASMFTHHVVAGMLGGAPDHDGDGLVGLDDLYGYVHAQLTAEHRQIPQRSFAGVGDVPMARRPMAAPATAEPSPPTMPDAAAPNPVLDVSETTIDLGVVDVDDDLPPERIGVVNRGGGDLRWSADCAAGWVTLTRDDYGVLLHLHPGAGTNRANVHVRDDRTGMVKTVRLVVRTRARPGPEPVVPRHEHPAPAPSVDPKHEPPADEPDEVPRPAATATAEPAAGPARPKRPVVPWFGLAIAATAIAGAAFAWSGARFLGAVDANMDVQAFLRDYDYGPGLGTSILGGVALVGVACAALVVLARRRPVPVPWRLFLLGLGGGLAAPLIVERTVESFRWEPAWFFGEWTGPFVVVPIVLGLVAAGLCGFALRAEGAMAGPARWAPPWVARAGAVTAALWGVASSIPAYGESRAAYVRTYFEVSDGLEESAGNTMVVVTMILLVGVLAATPVVATRWMSADAGRGLLLGAATFVVLVEAIEIATLSRSSEHRQGSGVLWMLIPAAAYVGTIGAGLRRSRSHRTATA